MAQVSPTAEELLGRYRASRQPRDLAALFDLAAPDLFRLSLHLLPDAATAEDVLQETFLAVMEHAEDYEPGRPALPWLGGILRNHAGMARRRAARRPDPDRAPRPADPDDPAALAETAEERARVHEAMQALPEPYRGVALLRWRYGLEPAEIADVRGVPPGTVWSLLSRALKRLKVEMGALPALVALLLRPERGLAGVRRALLRRAAGQVAAGTASGAGIAAAAATGGFLMAGKAAAVVASAAVLLGAAGWFAFREGPPAAGPGAQVVSHTDTLAQAPPPPPATAAGTVPVAPPDDSLPPPVDLSKCDRDLDLFGVVVDGTGAPVPGATLVAEEWPWQRSNFGFQQRWDAIPGPSTRSAADGTFSLHLRRGEALHLRASAPGFGETLLTKCSAGERVRVVLGPAASIDLLVKDEARTPVPDAGVLLQMTRIEDREAVLLARRETRTGPDGHVTLGSLPAGPAGLAVDVPAFARGTVRTTLEAGDSIPLEVVLQAGKTVEGRILDDATGDPLPGAAIGIDRELRNRVVAGADGSFRLRGWDPARQDLLVAAAPGHSRLLLRGPLPEPLEIRLPRGDSVAGRILGRDGAPAAGALVAALAYRREGSRQEEDFVSGTTGPDGRFRMAGLRHDLPHTLVILPGADGTRTLIEAPSAPEAGGVVDLGDIRIAAGILVEGSVRDERGAAVPGIEVECMGPQVKGKAGGDYLGRLERRTTDDLGRFRFPGQPAGTFTLEAAPPGAPRIRKELVLEEGAGTVHADLMPQAEETAPTLEIVVVDARGIPLAGVRTRASSGRGGNEVTATTASDGTARFPGQIGESARVMVREDPGRNPPRFLDRNMEIPLGGKEPVRVAVEDCVLVSGTVLGPDGKPVPSVPVFGRRSDGTFLASSGRSTDGSGHFRLAVPVGEEVALSLPDAQSGAAYGNLRGDLKGVRGPAEGLILQARAVATGRTLPVVVLDADGAPVVDASLLLLAGGRPKGMVVDAAGRAVFEGLPEDEVTLMVQRNFRAEAKSAAWDVSLPPPSTKAVPRDEDVVLRFRPGTPRDFRVLDTAGDPAANAMVSVAWSDDTIAWYPGDDTGRGRFVVGKGLQLRSIQAEMRRPDGTMESVFLEALPEGDGEVLLRLEPAKGR